MDVRCFDEGRLQIRRVGFVARNDAAVSISLDFAIFAFLALFGTPRHSGTPVLWLRFLGKLQAAFLPAKKKNSFPRAGVLRRQAMREAVHFPRFSSVPVSVPYCSEPRVVYPQRFRQ